MLGALPGAVDSGSTDLRGGGWEVMEGLGPPTCAGSSEGDRVEGQPLAPPPEDHHMPGRFGKPSGLPRPWKRPHQALSGSISRHTSSIYLSHVMLSPCRICAPLERHTRKPSGAREPLEGWQAPGGEASGLPGPPELGLRVRASFGESPGVSSGVSGLGGGFP